MSSGVPMRFLDDLPHELVGDHAELDALAADRR
jgi:hypothetical protein